MDIGWAIDKGFLVLKLSYRIYKAFLDSEENAPKKFRDLAEEFYNFNAIFKEYLDLLKESGGRILISLNSIKFTLEKCRLFLEKFGVLNEVSTGTTLKSGVIFAFRTIQWPFMAESITRELREELARHIRILTFASNTSSLRQTLIDARVENHLTREQMAELSHRIREQNELASEHLPSLDLPSAPHHVPLISLTSSQLALPDAPQHEPRTIEVPLEEQRSSLHQAQARLRALRLMLDDERASVMDGQTRRSSLNASQSAVYSILLAQQEVDLQNRRIDNYHDRLQRAPVQLRTSESPRLVRSSTGHSSFVDVDPGLISQPPSRNFADNNNPSIIGLGLDSPISPSTVRSFRPRQESIQRRSDQLHDDHASILSDYLDSFADELQELDRDNIDGQIEHFRAEWLNVIQRSLPPSPDVRLDPVPQRPFSQGRQSFDSTLSSSPPMPIQPNSRSRRPTFASIMPSTDNGNDAHWQYLARDVHIVDEITENNAFTTIPYKCSQCGGSRHTALQFARGSGGRLQFRLLCADQRHRPSDGHLFKHILSASKPVYPHIYHRGAEPGLANMVRLFGTPTKLLAYISATEYPLQAKSTGVCYKFASSGDRDLFQQLVYRARLLGRFDVNSVGSSADSGLPIRHIPLRVWQSEPSGLVSIMLHAPLINKLASIPYCEPSSAFDPPITSGNRVVKLKKRNPARSSGIFRSRNNSFDSTFTALSMTDTEAASSGSATPEALAKIKWIEIEFRYREQRDEFVEIWNNGTPVGVA